MKKTPQDRRPADVHAMSEHAARTLRRRLSTLRDLPGGPRTLTTPTMAPVGWQVRVTFLGRERIIDSTEAANRLLADLGRPVTDG